MSRYTEVFEAHVVRRITIEVTDAANQDEAEQLANMYVDFEYGRYVDGDATINVEIEVIDSEIETTDDVEWEDDDEDEEEDL